MRGNDTGGERNVEHRPDDHPLKSESIGRHRTCGRDVIRIVFSPLMLTATTNSQAGLHMEPENILETLVDTHPRVLINDKILEKVKARIDAKPDVARWYASLRSDADELLDAAPSHYEIPDGRRLLSVSRRVKERIRLLGLVYHVDGNRSHADRAIAEAMSACTFPDWNPAHFLDTAEMTYAVGMAYDWFYPILSDDQRRTFVGSIVEMGLKPGLDVYAKPRGWHKNTNNWNQVCNGGLGLGALAIADVEPAIASEILENAIAHIPAASTHYAPDGAGTEGVTYWDYGARYNCLFLEGLETALGTDFGLGDLPGFKESGDYQIYFAGADRMSFNFGDCGHRRMSTPMHFWMARRFGIPRYSWFRWRELQDDTRTGNALDILWYDDSGATFDVTGLARDRYFREAESATMRSSWDNDAIIVAFESGKNQNMGQHRHLDLGSFILDASGERWIHDTGTDRITYQRHKHGNERWMYYRLRAEGHNTLVFNPDSGPDQVLDAESSIRGFKTTEDEVTVTADLSQAYAPHASKVERTITMPDRRAVVITDIIDSDKENELYWFAHTEADIELTETGAVLTQNGKQLAVTIEQPSGSVFEAVDAKGFTTSPDPGKQADNSKMKKLMIRQSVGTVEIRVRFEPR